MFPISNAGHWTQNGKESLKELLYYQYTKNSRQDIDLIHFYTKFPVKDQSFALHVQEWEIDWSVQSQNSEI